MLSLKNLLNQSKALRPIAQQIELKKTMQSILEELLPNQFHKLFYVVSVKESVVTVEVINGMMASYFKQRQSMLLQQIKLNYNSYDISMIQTRVNAHLQEQFLSAVTYNPMNEQQLETLEHLANQSPHQAIQAGLHKILETQKRLQQKNSK